MGVVEFVNKTYDRGAWMEADKKKKIRGRPFLVCDFKFLIINIPV
jgi:hypothetical protein